MHDGSFLHPETQMAEWLHTHFQNKSDQNFYEDHMK